MKSIRLNKTIRNEILKNVMVSYDKEHPKEDLKSLESKAAYAIYDIKYKGVFPNSLSPALKEMLIKTSRMVVNYTGIRLYLKFGYNADGKVIKEYGSNTLDYVRKSKQKDIEAFLKAQRDDTKRIESRDGFKTQIEQLLASVNTTAQLVEIWAEVEKFIPDWIHNPSTISLPAIRTEDLNAALGE